MTTENDRALRTQRADAHRRELGKRRMDLLRLYESQPGMTYRRVSEQVEISAQRVGKLIGRARIQRQQEELSDA